MAKDIVREIEKAKDLKIKLAVTDIDGILRGKYIHKNKFLSAVNDGFGFCNVVFGWDSQDACYDNVSHTGWHTGYPDDQARIDLQTFRRVPWDNQVPFFLADFDHDVCPRNLLKRILSQAKKMGFELHCGTEYEFFNFNETPQSWEQKGYRHPETLTSGMFGYSILRSSLMQPYFNDLNDLLLQFDVPLEGIHTETGPGVYEAAIAVSDALTAADRAVLFKTSVKEIGNRHGILPSFMAKWKSDLPGCSGHIHQSLWKGSKNVFYSERAPHHMSPLFENYLAGQMELLPELLPFYAPTINSYKRLVEGLWAPTRVNWGVENRTAAFRVIPGSSKSTRLETRVSGSDHNPYLALAAAIGSGLYGIRKKLKLKSAPIVGNAYQDKKGKRLSKTLEDATEKLSRSQAAVEIFGETFVNHFVETRKWECREFQKAVTDWELQRYFEII